LGDLVLAGAAVDTSSSPEGVALMARVLKLASIALLLGFVAVVPGRSAIIDNRATDVIDGPVDGVDGPVDGNDGVGNVGGPKRSGTKRDPIVSGLECTRSKNGGATAPGVTATKIRLASTVVQSGTGASFLSASPTGMEAVVRAVNRAGGICGRLLELTLVDDAWDQARGLGFIKTFIAEKYFALPVVPSSEGLTAAIEAKEIDKAGIPVVGTDGMLAQQYQSPWVWPVATATVSTMRIMAKYAYEKKGARTFGIVWDTRYRFGREGAEAYRNYIKTLPGAKLLADVGIYPSRASYSSEIQRFNSSCKGGCDMVAMLLEPQTALTWVNGHPQFGTKVTSGAQTLFNEQFAGACAKTCSGMLVWTGYNPPIGNLAGLADVARYRDDVTNVDPKVDTTNQFLEGAYLGMRIFVDALRKVGPQLTRERLRDVLNSTCFPTDLASKLCWTTTQRAANRRAQAFSIVVAQGSFSGFRAEQSGFIEDPKG
jgi:ABC-type branched-subunit amino acid transport system substrate-binding protein